MKIVEGDLLALALEGRFDVIVHGCNCFHAMGAGIAKPIAQQFPEALEADEATVKGDRSKLGTISQALIVRPTASFHVVNAYTQFHWHGSGRNLDYDALESCFSLISKEFPNDRIAYPMIGAGLAGGDWDQISAIIDRMLAGLDHTLVRLAS